MSAKPHPMGQAWAKMPAVTGREGSYFYFRRDPETDHRQWFLQERTTGQWIYQDEDPTTGELTLISA